ncbi:uncharacterized protein LOC130625598 [Hydractinia symbiolongicarpus]|uniref:uncharacterized protein LOC130625598 n=1 Tax=Hydractinia symbiolongicarpus TaxID=13093 RepID=UPI00254A4AB3|nr:uncharacterized protein LOC130625598 [Hydractinia symbiolongicarpus]
MVLSNVKSYLASGNLNDLQKVSSSLRTTLDNKLRDPDFSVLLDEGAVKRNEEAESFIPKDHLLAISCKDNSIRALRIVYNCYNPLTIHCLNNAVIKAVTDSDCLYSSASLAVSDTGLSAADLVQKEAILMCSKNIWSSFICILALTSVLKRNISTLYPDCVSIKLSKATLKRPAQYFQARLPYFMKTTENVCVSSPNFSSSLGQTTLVNQCGYIDGIGKYDVGTYYKQAPHLSDHDIVTYVDNYDGPEEMESLLKRIVREEVERALSSNPSSSTFAPPNQSKFINSLSSFFGTNFITRFSFSFDTALRRSIHKILSTRFILIFTFVGVQHCYCEVEDIPDVDVRERLLVIRNCTESETFRQHLNDFIERFDFGYTKVNPAISEKEELLKTISHHWIISSKLEELQKFLNGLSCEGVLEILRKHPEETMKKFMYASVSSEDVKSIFNVVYTGKIEIEEDIIYNLKNFVDEVGFGRVKEKSAVNVLALEESPLNSNPNMSSKVITLEDFLFFLTGSKFLPNRKVDVSFNHHSFGNERVRVSTCELWIRFPVTKRYMDGEVFTQNILDDILDSPGFAGCRLYSPNLESVLFKVDKLTNTSCCAAKNPRISRLLKPCPK